MRSSPASPQPAGDTDRKALPPGLSATGWGSHRALPPPLFPASSVAQTEKLPRAAAALRPRVGFPRLGELRRPFEEDDARCGLDEREVGEGLGEVAKVVRGVGVELFCVQAEGGGDA